METTSGVNRTFPGREGEYFTRASFVREDNGMIKNITLPFQGLFLICLLPHLAQNPELLRWVLSLMHTRGFATTHPKPLLLPC